MMEGKVRSGMTPRLSLNRIEATQISIADVPDGLISMASTRLCLGTSEF